MGTLLTPRFAPTALSSEGTDCPPEDFQKMANLSLMVVVDQKGYFDNMNNLPSKFSGELNKIQKL